MSDTKISEAVVESILSSYEQAKKMREFAGMGGNPSCQRSDHEIMRAALETALPYLHPQPAELAEQQGVDPVRKLLDEWRSTPDFTGITGTFARELEAALAARQPVAQVPEWFELVIRDVCELEPEDPDAADTVCIRALDLRLIMERHAALAATGKQQVGEVHPDDVAVDAFAAAMKLKMADARAKGRGGWEDPSQCSVVDLTRLLRDHVEKGDPRDVANFCMMLHQRGEAIAAQVGEVQGDAQTVEKLRAMMDHSFGGPGFVVYGTTQSIAEIERRLAPSLAARQPGAQVPEWFELVIRDVCELEPEDPDAADTVCIRALDLRLIMERHAAPPAQGIDLGPVREFLRRRMAQWRSHLPSDPGAPGTVAISGDGEGGYNNDVRMYREGIALMDRVLALIDDQRDAAPGVGNG